MLLPVLRSSSSLTTQHQWRICFFKSPRQVIPTVAIVKIIPFKKIAIISGIFFNLPQGYKRHGSQVAQATKFFTLAFNICQSELASGT
jgi:hypothetical protein